MNRALTYLLLVTLVFVRALPLHGHWHAHADDLPAVAAGDHHPHLVHTHIVSTHDDVDHDAATVEINVFGSALARDLSTPTLALINTVFILMLVVLWICMGRTTLPRFRAPGVPLPPWRPSPRAPPR